MFKLANIIVDNQTRAVQAPTLYCRATALFKSDEKSGKIKFLDGGEFDFTTYFNAISVSKWRQYTVVDKFFLHLEIKGCKGEVQLTFGDQFSLFTQYLDGAKTEFDATSEKVVLDIELPSTNANLIGFKIVADSKFKIDNSYYYTDLDESNAREVNLSLCTTTFKKEEFIIPNVAALHENVFGDESDMKDHFWVHVVDNGRSLKDSDIPKNDHIFLHPNDNVGGAGGFTRGMLESMDQKEDITHVLLMDDDVSVSPESIKRTYNLLRLLNDEYKDAFVSGAMLDMDFPDEQWEDAGRIDEYGHFMMAKEPLRISKLSECVKNELFALDNAGYAAWWYCAIPVKAIKENGLPLPFFVRSDDTEYGLRCKPKFITMNSIGIWHKGFRIRYDAAVERYQTTRNTLMANAFTDCAKQEYFLWQATDAFKLEIKRFNYKNALLVIEALEDFLKGPEFIMEKGKAEEMFLEKHKTCEQLKPLDEALEDVPEEIRNEIRSKIKLLDVYREGERDIKHKVFDVASWNGQTLTGDAGLPNRDWVLLPYEGWFYMPEKQMGAKHIFAIDFIGKRAAIRHRDKQQFEELRKRFDSAIKKIKGNKDLIEKYRKATPYVTSEEFWREYLSMNK